MRRLGNQLAAVAGLAALSYTASAVAASMDPAIERLSSCETSDDGLLLCDTDDAAFRRLTAQLGMAFAPSAMHPARTTGFGGFELLVEGAYTGIDRKADYWRDGTRGSPEPGTNRASAANGDPPTLLQVYSLKLRKGLGYGVELGAAMGWMPQTTLASAGVDLRIALLEGFRKGALGYVPDVSLGSGVRTVIGSPQLHMTIAGLDGQLSKPVVFADTVVVTPWLGYQRLWIFADSRVVDLTPGADALEQCNYAGDNVPGNSDPRKNPDVDAPTQLDEQPVCTGASGTVSGFNQYAVFDDARLERERVLIGVKVRHEAFTFGTQLGLELSDPADTQNSDRDAEQLRGVARQWSLAVETGLAF